jgi:hypothetical protein
VGCGQEAPDKRREAVAAAAAVMAGGERPEVRGSGSRFMRVNWTPKRRF